MKLFVLTTLFTLAFLSCNDCRQLEVENTRLKEELKSTMVEAQKQAAMAIMARAEAEASAAEAYKQAKIAEQQKEIAREAAEKAKEMAQKAK